MPGFGFGAPLLGLYCERGSDPSFWAEPANAVSNAAFLIAGLAVLARTRSDPLVVALGVVTFAIGIGSFLFHTLATRGAMLADVAPIQIFIALYFFLALRRFLGLGGLAATFATAAFLGAASLLPMLAPSHEPWRGLAGYLGGLFGLLGVGVAVILRGKRQETGRALIAVAGLFALSLVFRTIDGAACATVSTGTHSLWHVTNALVLYLLMAIAARSKPGGGVGS